MRDALVDSTPAGAGARSSYLTYEPYYGLNEKAFSLSADPRFLYKGPAHGPMFDELRAGIRRREGIITLTGEPGTGKTTLCRSVLSALDRKTFCAFVPDPFVSREDLLKMLLIEFGVMSVEEVKSGKMNAATRSELGYPLYDFLRALVPLQAYAVLIIDEAQNLSSKLLEEIRILADLEGPEKLLQLVLVGQPELRDKLKDPTMRQVDQRISVRCSLHPLERQDLQDYIAHRLTVAGAGADRVEFTAEALDLLYNASHGNPRLLNLSLDKAMHHGHLDRTWTITSDIATAALGALGYSTPAPAIERRIMERRAPVPALLPADQFFSESSPEPPPAEESAADRTDFSPEEEAKPVEAESVAEVPRRRPRFRRAAILATGGIVLAIAGLGLSGWELWRQELAQPVSLPAVAAPPAQPVSAAVAPVTPPAEFFASAKP